MNKIKVLFVCLGNICRSPMAEGIFAHLVEQAGLTSRFLIDSAGTSGYHAGELADPRTRKTAISRGIAITSRSREFRKNDLHDFQYIIAMDRSNRSDILSLRPTEMEAESKVLLMRDFDEGADSTDVPDPYWSGQDGFEQVYRILLRSNRALLEYIRERDNI